LPSGRHSLRFLVRDEATGRGGSARLDVDLSSVDSESVGFAVPLFMDEPAGWLVVPMASRSVSVPETPFHVATDLFVPRPEPTLFPGRDARLCLMAFDGSGVLPESAVFELKAELVDGEGGVRAGRDVRMVRIAPGPDGFRRLVLSGTPRNVAPRVYRLRMTSEGPDPGQVRKASLAVRVEAP